MEQYLSIFSRKIHEWWTVKGLVIAGLLFIGVTFTLHQIHENSKVSIFLIVIFFVGFLLLWLFKNKIRKTKKNSLGIVLCVYSKDPEVEERIKEDFVSVLKESLLNSMGEGYADVIHVPYHIASRYDQISDATVLLDKAKAHYLVFGKIRKRGKRHIVDLTANVRHTRLAQESKFRFANEISKAWVARYNLDNAEEHVELFEITSDIISLCSKYIIGLAAFASSDFQTAEQLFIVVRNKIKTTNLPDHKAIKTMRRSVTHRINQIYLIQARMFLMMWQETHEIQNISAANEILKKVYGAYKRDGEFLTFKTILEVLLNKNYHQATNILNQIGSKKRDAIWYLNAGFLAACQGDEYEVIKLYRKADNINSISGQPLSLNKLTEFEEFISWYKNNENNSALLSFCLGFLNEKFKGDLTQSKNDYDDFYNLTDGKSFNKTRSYVEKKYK